MNGKIVRTSTKPIAERLMNEYERTNISMSNERNYDLLIYKGYYVNEIYISMAFWSGYLYKYIFFIAETHVLLYAYKYFLKM